MTRGFIKSTRGRYVAVLDPVERGLLRSLADQVMDLVAPEEPAAAPDPLAELVGWVDPDTPVSAPSDPAMARLFPDAYRDDAEASADFRRYTEGDLRREKLARAQRVHARVESDADGDVSVSLDEAEVPDWLGFLNDVRLILGTRLDITEDWQESGIDESAPNAQLYFLYDWLTYLQETLVQSMLDAPNPYE
ncbi:MAG: hypothetical protein RJB01_1146 [Actinomycetota bacterium]